MKQTNEKKDKTMKTKSMKFSGFKTQGQLIDIPVFQANFSKPRIRNNGYNVYDGIPECELDLCRHYQDYVFICFTDGKEAMMFCYHNSNRPGFFSFS